MAFERNLPLGWVPRNPDTHPTTSANLIPDSTPASGPTLREALQQGLKDNNKLSQTTTPRAESDKLPPTIANIIVGPDSGRRMNRQPRQARS